MSWMSNLAEAYDRVADIAGKPDKDGNVLLPQNHMAAKTDICITIDGKGNFRRAEPDKLSIKIPCTEGSASRTVGISPHPLHEQLGYLALEEKKRVAYRELLAAWSDRNSKVKAVQSYLEKGTLLDDLRHANITVDVDEYDENGVEKSAKKLKDEWTAIAKLFLRFRVEDSLDDLTPNLWEDSGIVAAWQSYCEEKEPKKEELCYVTGTLDTPTTMHPKGTNMSTYGAKLISCNDETNYTYKGRFTNPGQANFIGAKASHKAHAMLKYLIATQGYKCDSQAIVVWSIEDGSPEPDPFQNSFDLYGKMVETDSQAIGEANHSLGTDYAKRLRNALTGRGNATKLGDRLGRVAVMAVDAATTGRMGITFYQDLAENEYIERIIAWHESCKWWFRYAGQDCISAPSTDRIIAAVYGEQKGEGYQKIRKQARERMLHHIVCGAPLDRGWIDAAVNHVGQPFSYSKQDGGWDRWHWEEAMGVACAMVRKYYCQRKEVFSLELDKTCRDRDYLFGRLLAIADRLESRARYLQTGGDSTDKRPTNAVRYMSAFRAKPLRTWGLIYDQLNPYIQRLHGAEWYQQQIDEIMSLFAAEDLSDKSLGGKYLLGYSLQRRALMKKYEEETSK